MEKKLTINQVGDKINVESEGLNKYETLGMLEYLIFVIKNQLFNDDKVK